MKIALITGGSRGIGAATVKKFANGQYTVILNYNQSDAEAHALSRELIASGCDVHLYRADVTCATQVAEMFDWVSRYFKKIDVLVNNAGIALTKQIQDVTEAEYERVMDTNAKGVFLCSQRALPLLVNSGNGSIVNVASIWGVEGASCESVYAMSKFAVVGLTKSLAKELESVGITVNCVCPPIVFTDMTSNLTKTDVAEFCKEHSTRAFTPEEVADDIFTLAQSGKSGVVLVEE